MGYWGRPTFQLCKERCRRVSKHTYSEGKQLSSSDAEKVLLARSIIHKPNPFSEDPTDMMDIKVANEIIDFLTSEKTTGR
jgi:ABC-type ATPase involved in cell division